MRQLSEANAAAFDPGAVYGNLEPARLGSTNPGPAMPPAYAMPAAIPPSTLAADLPPFEVKRSARPEWAQTTYDPYLPPQGHASANWPVLHVRSDAAGTGAAEIRRIENEIAAQERAESVSAVSGRTAVPRPREELRTDAAFNASLAANKEFLRQHIGEVGGLGPVTYVAGALLSPVVEIVVPGSGDEAGLFLLSPVFGKAAGIVINAANKLPVAGWNVGASIERGVELAGQGVRALGYEATLLAEGYAARTGQIAYLVPEGAANSASAISRTGGTVTGTQWNDFLSAKYGTKNVFWDWPKNQGFVYGADEMGVLRPGQLIGRLGNEGGTFASPLGAAPESLSLRPGTDLSNLNVYRVIQAIPNTRIGPVAPAFDAPGYGVQYGLPKSVNDLLNPQNPYLERVTW